MSVAAADRGLARHNRPHFHAFYQEHAAVFAIDTIECLSGDLPKRQRRLVEAWAEIHRAELQYDSELLQSGEPWPNDADLDPATLHDWPDVVEELAARAQTWDRSSHDRRADTRMEPTRR